MSRYRGTAQPYDCAGDCEDAEQRSKSAAAAAEVRGLAEVQWCRGALVLCMSCLGAELVQRISRGECACECAGAEPEVFQRCRGGLAHRWCRDAGAEQLQREGQRC